MPLLEQRYPNARFTLLVGSDVALQLARWHNIASMIATCDFVIGLRSSETKGAVDAAMRKLGAHYRVVTTEHAHVSSKNLKQK